MARASGMLSLVVAAVSLGGAYAARGAIADDAASRDDDGVYAPSAGAAPYLSLGYREVAADLFYVRLRGYFGGAANTADGVASLVEAVVALDPSFYRVYEYGAAAITLAKRGVDQAAYRRAVAILERGTSQFPTSWRIPMFAGQMYSQDLETKDPAERRAWDERAVLLTESAVRKPDAPQGAAIWAAGMRSKLGQQDIAVAQLRELYLVTPDADARKRIVEKLSKLQASNADGIAAELAETRRTFETAWLRDRPAVRASTYILLGPPLGESFDLGELATGGRDLVGSENAPPLDPIPD